MPDKKQSNRVICEGGLDSTENHILLSTTKPGAATRLVNYEVGTTGGYKRLDGYEFFDEDFPEVGVGTSEGKVLGIIIFDNTATGTTQFIAARKLTGINEYELYLYTAGVGWVLITTGITREYTNGVQVVDKLRWDVGNDGEKNYLAITDGLNPLLLFDGSTWVEATAADTGANFANAGGNQLIDAPLLVAFSSNTLFVAYDIINDAEGIIVYSAPNAFYDFLTASGAGQAIPGFPIQQIKMFRKNLFAFGSNAISFLTEDVTAGFLVEDVTAGFLVEDVTRNMGLVARDAVVEIGGDLIFLGPDGFRPVAGTDKIGDIQLETISKPVQDVIRRYTEFADVGNINSVVIRNKSQFRLFFSDDTLDVIDAQGFIGCLRTADQQTGWEFGELLGFRVSCVTSRYVGTIEYVIHGDYDGKVYRQEMGNDLNGADMFSRYDTPYLDFGDTEIRKVIEKVTVFIKGSGDVLMVMGVEYDWGDENVSNPANYNIVFENSEVLYDDGVLYDSGAVYGGVTRPVKVTNVEGSFFSIRLRFTTYGADVPFTMHGIIFEYSAKGRI